MAVDVNSICEMGLREASQFRKVSWARENNATSDFWGLGSKGAVKCRFPRRNRHTTGAMLATVKK